METPVGQPLVLHLVEEVCFVYTVVTQLCTVKRLCPCYRMHKETQAQKQTHRLDYD